MSNKHPLGKYADSINITIQLAKMREAEPRKSLEQIVEGGFRWSDVAKALFAYMYSLDYENIKVLQTIMYIGRGDFDPEDGDDFEDYYDFARKHFDAQGWQKDKAIEVRQMFEKLPLAEYLSDGCKKIGLSLGDYYLYGHNLVDAQ